MRINKQAPLFGFHLPLQVWLYKIFPSAAKNFANRVDMDVIPKMLAWVPSEQPTFARVDEVLFSVAGDEVVLAVTNLI